jgi:hypothetical protein
MAAGYWCSRVALLSKRHDIYLVCGFFLSASYIIALLSSIGVNCLVKAAMYPASRLLPFL